MKRWIGRLLWIAAWCGWAWLGAGLHRELPRHLGPLASRLAFQELESPWGFIAGTHTVVTRAYERDEDGNVDFGKPHLRTWNGDTGERLTDVSVVGEVNERLSRTSFARHGIVIVSKDRQWWTMDVRAGRLQSLAPTYWRILDVHLDRPWVALHSFSDFTSPPKVRVLNWRSNDMLFEWTGEDRNREEFDTIHAGAFHPVNEQFAFVRERVTNGMAKTIGQTVFLCNIDERRIVGEWSPPMPIAGVGRPTADGIVAVQLQNELKSWCLVEVATGRSVHEAQRFMPDSEAVASIDERARVVAVPEVWESPVEWLTFPAQATIAIRALDSGTLRYRVWENHPSLDCMTSDYTLGVNYDGTLYKMPPQVNWPLLAVCQSILAAPLVLLWAFLRWRRRRKERFQRGLEA